MKKIMVGVSLVLLILGMPSYIPAQTDISQQIQNIDKLSLDIKGMDILDVFRLLSMRSGLNIIAGKNVTGKVTLFLKDVDTWSAFEIIVVASELAYEKRGDIIYVMTQRDYELKYGEKYEDARIVRSIKLKYTKAADVSKAVSQLKTNIGRVVADETSDTIVLMDVEEAVGNMERVIKELDIPLATKVYSLRYASADSLKDKLNEMLTKNVGSLRIDERTNKIAITDIEDRIPVFDKVISAFDEKHKEVLIEAKILQITLNDDYSMGINWDAIFKSVSTKMHNLATVGVNLKYSNQTDVIPTTASSSASGGAVRIGELSNDGYQAVIQALKQYGQTNILSSPRIVALNNEEAKILVGTNQPYATRSISQTSGGASNVEAENVTFIDLGVKLAVTPTINEDGYVTMKIKPEVSSSTGDYTIQSSSNTIPVVKTTTTETTVMVKDGATVVIGGLIEDRAAESTKEIPGFANIPLLGGLFKSKTRGSGDSSTAEKTELVIFLTPHIITGDEPRDILSVEKVAHDAAMEKFETDKELTKQDLKDISAVGLLPYEYYKLISSLIEKEVEKRKPLLPVSGSIIISFIIDRDGRLLLTPEVSKGDNETLIQIGIKSISEAAPFPPFPRSIDKDREAFEIAISYE